MRKGSKHSEEAKEKIRKKRIGKTHSEETKRKISIVNTGKIVSEEAIKKSSESRRGRVCSEESRKKMKEARIGKHLSEETKQKLSRLRSGDKSHWFGKHLPEETRSRISKSLKGYKHTEEAKAKMRNKVISEETRKKMGFGQTGRHHSEETRRKMGESKKGKKNPMYGKYGDKNHNWNPNLTEEERLIERHYSEYYEWRKLVYEKYDFTCQKCSKVGGTLNAHHIDDYANNKELRTTVENGITFCVSCHKDFHHQYGNESNTTKVEEFLKKEDYKNE